MSKKAALSANKILIFNEQFTNILIILKTSLFILILPERS